MKMHLGLLLAAVAIAGLISVGVAAEKKAEKKTDKTAVEKSPTSTPATASAPASAPADAKTYTGTGNRSGSQHRPQLMVGEKRYELKAADNAPADVKDTLKKISEGDTSKYTVVGAEKAGEGQRSPTITVYSITKVVEEKK